MHSPKWLGQLEETYGNNDIVLELLRAYLRDTRNIRDEIYMLTKRNEFEELYKLVHSLKSASAILGDSKLWQVLQKAEILLKSGNIVEGLKMYLNADIELTKLTSEIQDFLKKVSK